MTEFHKKESEELEKEHDKLYETLDEDRKKVRWISLRQRSVLCTTQSVQWYRYILKNLHDYKFWQILIVLSFLEFTRPSDSARNESETTERLWPGNHICFPLWWQGNQAVILDARLPRFFGGKIIKPYNGEKRPHPWWSNHAIS